MSGQSLTSLRLTPTESPQSVQKSPHEKEEIKLGELRGEITIATRERDNLKEEVEKLNRAVEFTKDRLKSDTEVKRLKIEKNTLLSQIKRLTVAVFKTKGYEDKLTKGLGEIEEDHVAFLNSISQALQLDIRSSTDNLTKKYAELTTSEDFLQGLFSYLEEYAQICEATTSQNALERTQLDKMGKEAVLAKNEASLALKRARSELSEADVKLKQARERFKRADFITTKLEKVQEAEEKRLEKWSGELLLKEKAVIAERRGFIDREKSLQKKEIKLQDKEQTLGRVYEEIRAKAKKLGIVI